jgi:RNA polymerase sigma-70 factor (ECF subfamily)
MAGKNATGRDFTRSYQRRSRLGASDDESIVERVLTGELGAFEDIVRRWQGPLVNLAYRFCHDRSRAEDMAQEAFLRAWRALRQWRKDAPFSTWLFSLATNLYRSELRRIPANTVSLADTAEPGASGATDMEEKEQNRVVKRAVLGLPPKYREALILFYFHEQDVPSAARSLGIPEGTMKARLSRGRGILRNKLQKLSVKSGA